MLSSWLETPSEIQRSAAELEFSNNEASLLGEQRETARKRPYAGGLGRAAHQWGQGATPLRRGPGVCPHTPLAGFGARSPKMLKRSP
jgi:hypothetical protein